MLMEMNTLCASSSSGFSSLFRGTFCITRTRITFPEKLFFCKAKLAAYSSGTGSFNSTVVPPTLLAAEKEEAKSVLSLFLKKQGLSKVVAAKTITKSDLFIDHLVSKLHSVHKSRYLVGRELTTFEIRDTLIPYIESLLVEHGNNLVNLVESFPNTPVRENAAVPVSEHHSTPDSKKPKGVSNAPVKEKPAVPVSQSLPPPLDLKKPKVVSRPGKEKPAKSVSQSGSALESKKPKAVFQMIEDGAVGDLRPQFLYLLELGMDLEQIKVIIRRYPDFAYCSLEGKIKPLVEFLLDLGVPKSDIPKILIQRPSLCSVSLSDNLIPTMMFLEDLGVDKEQWAKVIYRFPGLLTHSRQKVQAIVDFLHESGLSSVSIGKILTRWPKIVGYSVEENLRPTVEYFRSLGVDISILLRKSPLTLGHSIEGNLKPVTEFFLAKGYNVEEVRTMISRYAALYTCSLTENLMPKWEFFLTMGYEKSELVKFPQYFSYSLEQRIRPRYVLVKESGVKMLLTQMLSLSDFDFEKVLKMKILKMVTTT